MSQSPRARAMIISGTAAVVCGIASGAILALRAPPPAAAKPVPGLSASAPSSALGEEPTAPIDTDDGAASAEVTQPPDPSARADAPAVTATASAEPAPGPPASASAAPRAASPPRAPAAAPPSKKNPVLGF